MAIAIYGQLKGEKKVFLGVSEKHSETDDILTEYEDVFGMRNIEFSSEELSAEELACAKQGAFVKLFSALYGPINTLFSGLKN